MTKGVESLLLILVWNVYRPTAGYDGLIIKAALNLVAEVLYFVADGFAGVAPRRIID